MSALRTAGRLVALARPKGALLIASLPVTGFGYGLWEMGSTIHPRYVADRLVLLFGIWIVAHAGTMWLNAALDDDQGEVLLGRAVKVPKRAALYGYVAIGGAVAVSWALGPVTFGCAAICAVLSVLYSHPDLALKPTPVGGPLVNGVGYGALSPIAGWAATGVPLSWRAVITVTMGVVFLLGIYWMAQVFQHEEDAERGYRTLVVTAGPQATLRVASVCLIAAAGTAVALCVVGVYPRAVLASVPFWIWMVVHLRRWARAPNGGTQKHADRLVLIVTLGTVAAIAGAYAHQAHAIVNDLPTGGCGTAIVPAALADVCAS